MSEREAAEAARKAERQSAADRIYDKLRLEKEAALRAQVCLGEAVHVLHNTATRATCTTKGHWGC